MTRPSCSSSQHSSSRAASTHASCGTTYLIVASYAVVNIPVQRTLWSPLTWPMWRAAGGPLADSIRHYATWSNAGLIGVGLAVIAVAPIVCRRVPASPVLIALAACTALGPAGAARVDTLGLERNAWTALVGNLTVRLATPASRDWRASALESPLADDFLRFRGAANGRNVVLVSLESTAARYLGMYGAQPDVAPNLSELSRSAMVFESAYAVYPESIKGLFSILCSVPPAFDTTAESYAGVPCNSIAAVLGEHGYRTGLFHSGRFGYLGMNAIIQHRGYDVLADAGDIGGQHDSSFGIDEPSTVASILKWIDAGPPGRPFFVTYLPIAGHHPYETPERGPFPDRDEFGRYRNALHYGDAALGALRRGLEARGLDRNALWIVLGDHGEAFGQHEGNYGHTFQLYDENVRVPYLIAAPGLLAAVDPRTEGRQPARYGADATRPARIADPPRLPGSFDVGGAVSHGAVLHRLLVGDGRSSRRAAQIHPRHPIRPVEMVRHRQRSR